MRGARLASAPALVRRAGAQPLFRRLSALAGPPSGNVTTYLVDRRGRPAARFDSAVEPDEPALLRAIGAVPRTPAAT